MQINLLGYYLDIKYIKLHYAASHPGGLKVYNRMMSSAGYKNKLLDNLNWNDKNEVNRAHNQFRGSIKWELEEKKGGNRFLNYTGF